MIDSFTPNVLTWFDQHGRKHLPWQKMRTPYRVWISEIMLQQTQVNTVIPYYQRFMLRFPELNNLAKAPIDDVLALWTGLGYYTRARNLHLCAQQIMDKWHGQWPTQEDELQTLPGIGQSTAAAIVSQAFDKPATILDGNVKRVLARFYGIEGWPGQASVANQLWQLARQHTPKQRCRDYTQAIMDFGATLCKRQKPLCMECPVQAKCQAWQQNKVASLPTSKPKKERPHKKVWCALIVDNKQCIGLENRPSKGIWGGLWSLPEFSDQKSLLQYLAMQGISSKPSMLAPVLHAFSHYKLTIYPCQINLSSPMYSVTESQADKLQWYAKTQINTIGLPSPIKKILHDYWQS